MVARGSDIYTQGLQDVEILKGESLGRPTRVLVDQKASLHLEGIDGATTFGPIHFLNEVHG